MRRLLDFDLVIESDDDGYRTRVIGSPGGEADARFDLPFTDKDLKILVLEVVGSISRVRRKMRRIDAQDRQLIEAFGGQLFTAVFSGPVGECLERSRVNAGNRDAGLRIRLRLPPALANIPWEYLYDTSHGFLGLDPDTALVRYLELPSPVGPLSIRPPLRILAMISAPSDLAQLDAEQEWAKLDETFEPLRSQGLVEVDRLADGTLTALHRPLQLHEYHVLHFIGHGGFDEEAQDGAVALEDATGKARMVTGRELSTMIRHPSLRLVVLNACEGSRVAAGDPFSGVAQALARQGIPAVIAMQFEISDPAALAFSQSFYQGIADGLPVDTATVEARRAMFAGDSGIEWATPVLYLRSTDGRVFRRRRAHPKKQDRDSGDQGAEDEQASRRAEEEAKRQADEEARRQAEEEAKRQAEEEAKRQADEEARRRAGDFDRMVTEYTRPLNGEQPAHEHPAGTEPSPAQRPGLPVPVYGPIILSVPLLILATKVLTVGYHLTRPWALTVLCSAILGGAVAAAESRRNRTQIWTAALEFFFAWFVVYAIYKLSVGHVHRVSQYLPVLAILAGVGALVSLALGIRALARSPRKEGNVHPLLPAFLFCLTAGLGTAAIGYASTRYPQAQILQSIGPDCYHIGAVFLFAALVVNLLAPLRTLVRRLQSQ